jgi:tetratricopeptide (TPR) repeat protein
MNYLRARAGLDETQNAPDASRGKIGDDPDLSPSDPVSAEPALLAGPPADQAISCTAFMQQAEQAQAREEWPEAEHIWRAIRKVLPQLWFGYSNNAIALAGLGRYDEAREVLSEGAVLFPHERAFPIEQGRLAMRLSDWPAAEIHWRAALQYDVRPWWVYTELAGTLERQGRFNDAEAVLAEALERCDEPDEITLYTHPARLAGKREDWSGAVARWAEAQRRFPGNEQVALRLYEAVMRLAEHDPAAAVAADRNFGIMSAKDEQQALMLCFESLGGAGPAGGCEFGGLQRALGVEPLGLFRWASVEPANLIACLEDRFRTIGDENTTSVRQHDEQWEIREAGYGTSMHSFVACADVPADGMVIKACKRMRFMREKLIADLESSEKIFVLKVAAEALTAAETKALSRAMQTYGASELLCVCAADVEHPEGKIARAAPGVLKGYIDFASGLDIAARHAAWIGLCRTMIAMSLTSRHEPPAGLVDAISA